MECTKCGKEFKLRKGLKNYCSLACRNSRPRNAESRNRTSEAARQSDKVKAYQDRRRGRKTRCRVYFESCRACSKLFTTKYWGRKVCSEECRVYHIMTSRSRNVYKRGEYNGNKFDSSWEVAIAKYLDNRNVK